MTLTQITEKGIKDGEIINADINASAAIQGSKIDPNFGSQNIVTTGDLTVDTTTLHVDSSNNRVGIGTTTPNNTLDVNGGIVCSPNTDGKNTFELSTHGFDEGRLSIKNVDTTTIQFRAGGDSFIKGGHLDLASDSYSLRLGASQDLQISHNGSLSRIQDVGTGQLEITTNGSSIDLNKGLSEYMGRFKTDGAVELYYDGIKKLTTYSTGVEIHGSEGANCELYLYADEGDDDADNWKLTALASESMFQLLNRDSGSWEKNIEVEGQGKVKLYWDNSKKFETISDGVNVEGITYSNGLVMDDNHIIKLGTGRDLEIYHDGTNSNVINATNDLILQSTGDDVVIKGNDDVLIYTEGGTENAIFCRNSAQVELYYNGNKKFHTLSDGCYVTGSIKIQGQCLPTNDHSGLNLGSSSLRWSTVYAANGSINTSDRNEKNTIVESDLGLNFINNLKPVSFKWNKDDGKTHYGLIAQDIEETITNLGKTVSDFGAISKEKDSPMGLNYSQIISPLIKAIQELSAENEILKTEKTKLQTDLTALTARVVALETA